jgi:hypothetical protein
MEEGVFDIELVHWPIPRRRKVKNRPSCHRFDDRREGLVEVEPGAL